MQAKAKIKQISYGINGGYSVMFDITETTLEDLKRLEPEFLSIELKKYRKQRSRDANSYFHVLVGEMAAVLNVSRQQIKNEMIGRYGQPEIIDDKNVYFTTQLEPEYTQELNEPHLVLTHVECERDEISYSYMVMRGSHTYNTKEMSILIDGTVQEAKDLGIETLTPNELERMKQQWPIKK